LPKDIQLEEGQSAYSWPIPKPFSEVVREAIGYPSGRTLSLAILKLAEAQMHFGDDYEIQRKLVSEAVALLMTTEYDMLEEVMRVLQVHYGFDPGVYEECHYQSAVAE
jgi:hypothetical protein